MSSIKKKLSKHCLCSPLTQLFAKGYFTLRLFHPLGLFYPSFNFSPPQNAVVHPMGGQHGGVGGEPVYARVDKSKPRHEGGGGGGGGGTAWGLTTTAPQGYVALGQHSNDSQQQAAAKLLNGPAGDSWV